MSSKEQRLTDPAAAIFVICSEDKKVKRRISMMCFLAVLLATFFAGCGGKEADNTQDTNPPFVSLTTPLQGAGGVIMNPLISATFSKAVNASTINTATFNVASAGDQLTGTVALTGNTAIFTPTNRLVTQDATYTATITNGVKDLAGTSMQAPYVWTFETVAVPSVVSASPADGAIGVPVSQELAATFLQDPDSPNEALNCSTLTAASFTLTASSGTVAGAVTCVGAIAAFSPTLLLAQNTMYTATITSGVRNLAGMGLTTPYVWTFTTGLQPTVVSTIPANGASDVLSDQTINATLSAVMNCSTLYAPAKTFTLNGPRGTAIAGTVNCTGSAVSFVPATQLAPGTLFSAAISNGATDAQGQPLVPGVTPNPWTFRTAGALITPKVTSTNPGNTSAGAPFNQIIVTTFSETMNLATLNKMTFLLIAPGGTAVAGAVTSLGSTAKFTPATNLAPLTTYIATITTGATDLAGNPLAANYVWSFTTGAAPDTAPPTITSTNPANNVTGVPFNQAIAVTFSEGMNPASVTNASLTLTGPGGAAVAGTVAYVVSGSTATFTPSSPLPAASLFTATITTGATDLAGNALAANYVWSFTTGAAPDSTPPTITSTNPANNVTGVPFNQAIAVTFSEGMNPASVTSASLTLTSPGGAAVAGTVAYVVSGSTATFTPSSPLPAGSLFTATITTAATDLAGNALAANYVWSFTTGAALDTTPPTITSTNPANGSVEVAITAPVNASFSEAMDTTTITSANFQLTGPADAVVTGTVTYDAMSFIATFTPSALLAGSTTYTATITNTATDLAGNTLASGVAANPWSFTTSAVAGPPPVALGTASVFGGFGSSAGMTNQGTSTVINGNIGTTGGSGVITGFHDNGAACTYTETTGNIGLVNGAIDTAPPSPTIGCPNEGTANTSAIAAQVASDTATAYADLVAFPGGLDVSTCPGCGGGSAGELGGRTLVPGTYKSVPTTYGITMGDLILDAQGDSNAYWVFQMGTSLTVGTPTANRSVLLLNGAQAKNVFWQVGSAATINGILGGGTMVGTIISQAAISVSTAGVTAVTTINGRALCLAGPVTLVNTVIDVPAP